ncbi:hypothetical protein NA57DRAFT_59371 [Rhizodiscina lignyota]|uniref:NADAR domain-containing protein n=1 Tax=Rhizodiscina lignyota TaxID=1504668 RepID=A0A9P4M358_9PEZI|nr:hypothetical protein NA57DRAFT_59371 [Rhizodiscina lignyota]
MAPTKDTNKDHSGPDMALKPKKDSSARVSKNSKPPRDPDAIYFGNSWENSRKNKNATTEGKTEDGKAEDGKAENSKPEETTTKKTKKTKGGSSFCLSNMAICHIHVDDKVYMSAENYYHAEKLRLAASYVKDNDQLAQKFHDAAERVRITKDESGEKLTRPRESKKIAHEKSIEDSLPETFKAAWEPAKEAAATVDDPCLKNQTMWKVLKAKFTANTNGSRNARTYLLKTGNKKLYQIAIDCPYFGLGRDERGMNMLGLQLMQLRNGLRSGVIPIQT